MPGTSMANFVDYLNSMPAVGRPVLNKTDLKGPYDITLDWTPDSVIANGEDGGPSIFTAVQERLGLKLEPTKSSFEFVVIDHVERPIGELKPDTAPRRCVRFEQRASSSVNGRW